MNHDKINITRPQYLSKSTTQYRGRFAPSPSGFLHFGSLVAALASYLHAKHQQGLWLVRIEDIDPPREMIGASSAILATLDAYGLHWDEPVLYQSQQSDLYRDVLQQLAQQKLIYHCQCTRAQVKAQGGIYQGQCKDKNHPQKNSATRLRNLHGIYHYHDLIQGDYFCPQKLAKEDFILARKDGLFAYQLAVVVDDIYQNVSHVIRGCDLLEPTVRQLSFYQQLGYQAPQFGHVPLAVTEPGFKLSKQNKAPAIDNKNPTPSLIAALNFLGQHPPEALYAHSATQIIEWAIENWSTDAIPKQQEIAFCQ
ncbi:tRNA glutamyl-Q(34) synthetase GluQRS [Colwellia hornerae]|uniref:Glutamyl-Q tRNA(Asp) synthetase n=1 Tax=Colwellia hornerae TaxID=89402 RepID=A0A5C6QKI0_9GAMM|nr:tRNA glutamyl-Q(34) synthetase GluQRS [Colwellia hornerae]TWX58616.1 tRNA glutamyl-Q(34) synthetase GluQRS [Colwellia hornerae]TWX59682.1 tRNA glutamyl-Q(34) synthetase GluQRS [Colwellia hornerae]TWX69409.1 tRNA glutamyl-Q(34) synthetase GluQRS [Colwellia hornerae]